MEQLEREITLLEEKLRNTKYSDEEKIDILLTELDIKSNREKDYLKDILLICMKNPNYMDCNMLYTSVAKKNSVTERNVQGYIKTVVEKICNTETDEKIKAMRIYVFGNIILEKRQFLSADLIFSLINFFNELNQSYNEKKVTKLLKNLAFKPGIIGYNYLQDAINLCMCKKYEKIGNSLYSDISQKYDYVLEADIGPCIRYLVKLFFKHEGSENTKKRRQEVFGNEITERKGMSNTDIITYLVGYLKVVA